MALSALDPFACIVAHLTTVRIGFDALAIENACCWSTFLVHTLSYFGSKKAIDLLPCIVSLPFAENVIDCLPGRKIIWQHSPLDATLDDIEDGIQNEAATDARAPSLFLFWQHRLDQLPLSIGQIRRI